MRKAFICHSSMDKDYARFVSKKLRRANVVFDAFSFEPGHDFREEIIKHIDQSALFVFLASSESLQSTWCQFEIDQAQLKKMDGGISRQLAIIIDPTVSFRDLPNWMRGAKALVQTRPSQAVRDIQQALFPILFSGEVKPFLGRQALQTNFYNALISDSPQLFVINGLEGIGRRSYLKRVTLDSIGLNIGPFFVIDETHAIEDVYLQVLEETADIGTRRDMASEVALFNTLDEQEQFEEIVKRLHMLCSDRNLPCFVDSRGILEDAGGYKDIFDGLMTKFIAEDEDHYLAFIHRRKPDFSQLRCKSSVLSQKVQPLKLNDTKLLLGQLFKLKGINTAKNTIHELASIIGGYPPAAQFTATYSKLYGIDTVMADKSILTDFKARNFSRFVTDLDLSQASWVILQYLCFEVAVPLTAISIVLGVDLEATAPIVKSLIDQSLLQVFDDSYAISSPIREAVQRVKGNLSKEQYSRIADKLTKAFWANEDAAPSLCIVDATLHAVARSENTSLANYDDLVRPSTIHRLAIESYHRREWESALEYAKRVEIMDPRRRNARAIHFKSLVQLERWDEAEDVLGNIEAKRDKLAFYLKGFMLRRRGEHKKACQSFEAALRSGDKANAVYRDYADSLYRLGEFEKAEDKVKVVSERDPENVFILDLLARVYLDLGAQLKAKEVIHLLERYDITNRFIYHRKAALFAQDKLWDLALIEAEAACKSGFSPFAAFAQKANILIEIGKFSDARYAIDNLEKRFRTQGRDVRYGLSCKLLLREGHWREARTVWDSLEDKKKMVHRRLLLNIYTVMANDNSLSLKERTDVKRHTDHLTNELEGSLNGGLLSNVY